MFQRFLDTFMLAAVAVWATGCGEDPVDPPEDKLTDSCIGQESGQACTWLGVKGEQGFNGDGEARWATVINQVQDLIFLEDGSAWFSDFNNYLLRRVLPDDSVESMVGWTDPVFPGDGPPGGPTPDGADGELWQLNHPTNLMVGPSGDVLLVAWHNHKILTIDPDSGHVKVVCGAGAGFAGDGGPAAAALFRQPVDGTIDEDGNIYLVDQANLRVRLIDNADMVSTIAGTGMAGSEGDGGPAADAAFAWEAGSNPNPSGGIVHHEGKLYISDTINHRIRVLDLAAGTIDAFAGTGEPGFSGDGGPALEAQLHAPRDLDIGPEGDLYVADTDNGAVRAIDLASGEIRTVAGTGELGLGDKELEPATETLLRRPFGVAFDPDGNLYIMDSLNSRIVKVMR